MRNSFAILFILFLTSCTDDVKKQEYHSVYDEAALKNFVVSTQVVSAGNAMYSLDSILNKAAGDSGVFYKTVSYLEVPLGGPSSDCGSGKLCIGLLRATIESPWF